MIYIKRKREREGRNWKSQKARSGRVFQWFCPAVWDDVTTILVSGRRAEEEKSKYLIAEALYLDMEDFQQGKADGTRERDRQTDRQTDRDRVRETETQRETQRERRGGGDKGGRRGRQRGGGWR